MLKQKRTDLYTSKNLFQRQKRKGNYCKTGAIIRFGMWR